jgi:outer membrane protein TolC
MKTTASILALTAVVALSPPLHGAEAESAAGRDAHTLASYIERARTHNPMLRARRSKLSAARHAVRASVSLPNPTLGAGVGIGGESVMPKLTLSQGIPWPGRLTSRKRQSEHNYLALSEDLRVLENHVLFKLRKNYAMLYKSGRMIALLEQTLELLKQAEAVSLSDYSSGRKPQLALLKLQLEMAVVEDRIAQVQTRAGEARDHLGALLDIPPAEIPFPSELPVLSVPPDPDDAVQIALDNNPEMRVVEHRAAQANENLKHARHGFGPDMMVSAEYFPTMMWGGEARPLMLMGGVSLPLWGGSRVAAVNQAKDLAGAAQVMVEKEEIDLAAEAQTLHREHGEAVRRVGLLDDVRTG